MALASGECWWVAGGPLVTVSCGGEGGGQRGRDTGGGGRELGLGFLLRRILLLLFQDPTHTMSVNLNDLRVSPFSDCGPIGGQASAYERGVLV